MKEHPDVNDTLRDEGVDAVRARHDRARKFMPENGAVPTDQAMNGRSTTRSTSPRIRLIPFEEIRLGTQRRCLVQCLIPRVGLTVVWGPPKCGKSFWTFDLMMHVALGWKYRGRRVHQGPAIYCAFEGQTGIEDRVEAFRKRHLVDHAGKVPFFLEPVTLDLVRDHRNLIAAIKRQLGDEKPVAVTLDTLNRSLRGSESSDEDMTAYVNAADAIRAAFDCAVIIIHHCGTNQTRPRGHTALTGAADAQLAVKRDPENNVIVEVEWMKDGPEGDVVASTLEVEPVGKDEDGETLTSCVVVPADGVATTAQPKLAGATGIAFKLLQQAVDEAGEIPPASNHIPGQTRTTTLATWRRYCYQGTVAESDNPDARQKAFVRASRKLQSTGMIGIWGEFVWISRTGRT
jgi:AAA domain